MNNPHIQKHVRILYLTQTQSKDTSAMILTKGVLATTLAILFTLK